MSFPINTGIPAAGNRPSADQPLIQANFANINSFLSVDHIAPGTNNTAGYHSQVHLINEAAPGIGFANSVLYSNIPAGDTKSWPFWQNSSGIFQMMGTNIGTVNNGQAFLPGGIIIKWGFSPLPGGSTGSVTFSPPFPNNCFTVFTNFSAAAANTILATITIANDLNITSPIKTGFGFKIQGTTGGSNGFYWLAIGN
jgi:hypothetical protein